MKQNQTPHDGLQPSLPCAAGTQVVTDLLCQYIAYGPSQEQSMMQTLHPWRKDCAQARSPPSEISLQEPGHLPEPCQLLA